MDHSEEDENKFEKIKKHLKEHRREYFIGAGCLTVGYLLRPQMVNVVDVFNIKYKSPTTTTVVTILERRACKEPVPVRCVETGEVFGSIRRAAALLDIPRQKIADQMRGKIPEVDGFHFELVA